MRVVLRFRPPRGVPGGYVGASLALHLVIATGVCVIPLLRPRQALPLVDATFVELAGALPTPSRGGSATIAAPPSVKPPPPAPPKEPEGAHAVERVPPPKPPQKKKEPDKKKEEAPAGTGTAPPPSATPPAPGSAGTGGPTGITTLEGGGVPGAGWYNAAVTGALQAAWIRPVLEGAGEVYAVVVAFEIGRDGNVFNLAVDVPSGVAVLDRSALRAVTDAAPFPAPPASAGGSVRQRIRFELTPE